MAQRLTWYFSNNLENRGNGFSATERYIRYQGLENQPLTIGVSTTSTGGILTFYDYGTGQKVPSSIVSRNDINLHHADGIVEITFNFPKDNFYRYEARYSPNPLTDVLDFQIHNDNTDYVQYFDEETFTSHGDTNASKIVELVQNPSATYIAEGLQLRGGVISLTARDAISSPTAFTEVADNGWRFTAPDAYFTPDDCGSFNNNSIFLNNRGLSTESPSAPSTTYSPTFNLESTGFIFISPDGQKWLQTVDNSGVLTISKDIRLMISKNLTGPTDTYGVKLNSKPSSRLNIDIKLDQYEGTGINSNIIKAINRSSFDPGEYTFSPSSMTFTNATWNREQELIINKPSRTSDNPSYYVISLLVEDPSEEFNAEYRFFGFNNNF